MRLVPRKIPVETEEVEGCVVLIFPKNLGRFERKLQKLIGGPDEIRYRLDEKGSYLWRLIDGDRTVEALCNAMWERFQEEIEPVFARTWQFVSILAGKGVVALEEP